jgi:DNA (cytosine-5)-methyltransferase 3A
MEKYCVLALFDGISSGRLALQRANIPVSQYFASEIDKNAIKVSKNNWPEIIQLGDVRNVRGADLPKIDILLAGSPCQGFSFAGKQLNFDDPRSQLFFEFVRILKEVKPKYFLLENVRMKKEFADKISEELGVGYIEINSSKVSAQNRLRYYWHNIPCVTQPEDKGIMLVDIIDQDYDGIWVWPRGTNPGGIQDYNGKSPSITTSSWQYNFLVYKDGKKEPRFSKSGIKMVGHINKISQTCRIYADEGKSPALSASGRYPGSINGFLYSEGKVRKFTINEAELLQTLPPNYTTGISDNQRFKCCGNGWTIDVIAHILKYIPH